MAKFLLWNVQRKPLESLVLTLVGQHAIDVVLLVEYGGSGSALPDWLARSGYEVVPSHPRFGVFIHGEFLAERLDASKLVDRVDYFRLTFPSGTTGLVALLHSYDRRNYGEETRAALFADVASNMRREEERNGHRRSIIAGDFNSHPFDAAATGHQFTLFRVRTGIQPFPATLEGAVHPSQMDIANPSEFHTKIATVLNSPLTHDSITNILANLG